MIGGTHCLCHRTVPPVDFLVIFIALRMGGWLASAQKLECQNSGLDHKSSGMYLRQALLSMLEYTGEQGRWVLCIPIGIFYVVFFDGSSPCDLLPSPGSSDVLIKSESHECKTDEERGLYLKRLMDPNVTLVGRASLHWGLRSRCCGWRPVPHAAPGEQGMLPMSPPLLSTSVLPGARCPLKCSPLHFIYLMKYGFD